MRAPGRAKTDLLPRLPPLTATILIDIDRIKFYSISNQKMEAFVATFILVLFKVTLRA
jgi:hypothetical protein